MKLGFVSNSTLVFDGKTYWYQSGEWRYLEGVAPLFDEVDICTAVVWRATNYGGRGSPLSVPNGTVFNLNESANKPKWIWNRYEAISTINKRSSKWDFAFIVTPSWPALFCWWYHKRDKWPYALSARLDWSAAIALRSSRPPWVRLLLRPYIELAESIEYRLFRDASIQLVSGRLLLNKYPEAVRTSLHTVNCDLSLDDFRKRVDTCNEDAIRIVYAGSLVDRKAVHLIIEAVSALINDGYHLRLDIIGSGAEESFLRGLAEDLSIKDQTVFHGHIYDRKRLLDELYQSDIFVIASYSEGFPRVIYEAMSQSLPVVASRVGGIPGFIEDEETALLVSPGKVHELTDAIRRIIEDVSLRRKLIQNGYNFAYHFLQSDPLGKAVDAFRIEVDKLHESNAK